MNIFSPEMLLKIALKTGEGEQNREKKGNGIYEQSLTEF